MAPATYRISFPSIDVTRIRYLGYLNMRACIHRGAHQVGGSCVEIEHEGFRLVLDAGLPLGVRESDAMLPTVDGIGNGSPSLLGLILSHGHPDHYGLIARAHPSIPRYLGEATQRILREATFFTQGGADIEAAGHLVDRTPIRIGPFTVTPYLMDHSAFDAYALLIEAGGSRLFYSGDFRGHGRKSGLFERFLAGPPKDIDALLLEGTNIRATPTGDGPTEKEVEAQCAELFMQTKGIVLACYSPQNIDRLVTLFRATTRAGRMMILDLYAATIARASRHPTIPQAHWKDIRVFVPLSQRIKVKNSGEFDRINWVGKSRVYHEALTGAPQDYVMTFRHSMAPELDRINCLDGAQAIWSMWAGYLEEASGQQLRHWLAAREIPLTIAHSSGHATTTDLQRLAAAINARAVVPIHTRQAERYSELFENVRLRGDGEWWAVSV